MAKKPKIGRWIREFVYRFLSRMLRIDFMNHPVFYKHRNKHFVITFGIPIPYQTFDKRFTPVQWAARVKDYSCTLAENPEGVFSDINN